ncbi:MAG: ABC transporter ATP-binding protein [Christensenellales bacterium]
MIVKFLKKYGWRYIPGCIFLFLSSYIQTLAPKALGHVFDVLELSPDDHAAVYAGIQAIILIALAAFVTRFIWRYFINGNARNLECFLREELFLHLQQMNPHFFNHQKTGDLIAYAINDINAVRMTFGPGLAMVLNGLGVAILSIGSMAGDINLKLTLVSLLPIPFIIVFIVLMGGQVRKRFRRVQETFAQVSDRVNENINGIRVIKAYVQEDAEVDRFEALNNQVREANVRMVRVSSMFQPLVQIFFGISFAISIFYGTSLAQAGEISIGDVVAFNSYLTIIMMPIISISRIINVFQRGTASYRRLMGILDVPPMVVDGDGDPSLTLRRGEVEIRDLTFTYPGTDQPVLEHIDLHIAPGQTLGILGYTGSGKTTLVNLLLKLYNPPEGAIFMDGVDITHYRLGPLRENIGYVPQDNFLFSASIAENIKFFSDQYSQQDVEHAAKAAMIHHNIVEFPEGYQTQLGDRGVNLSGGQKQRISIARALIKQPALYIMDDALSAVDTETEEAILHNFSDELAGKSGIIIAHRISAVQNCDQIIYLEHGRIVERGDHESLLAAGGRYAQLYAQQSQEDERGVGA